MSSTLIKVNTITSLKIAEKFFNIKKINFWIEAGTALAAWRDGKLLDWDHDIDIAIWYDDCPLYNEWIDFFADSPYQVVFQKDLPYIDNIIQLKHKGLVSDHIMDIDIYLYKRQNGFAYMRWIHNPVGNFAPLKRTIFSYLSQLLKPRTPKWRTLSKCIPFYLRHMMFWSYMKVYMRITDCVFHRFDEDLFLNLKTIKLYGMNICIAQDTDRYLAHRYGENWRKPDPTYNQQGTWKKSKARPRLRLNTLPLPKKIEVFDDNVYSR